MNAPYRRTSTATSTSILLMLLFCGSAPAARLGAQTPVLNVEDDVENPLFQVHDNGALLGLGELEDGLIPQLGAGVRFMWLPTSAAFRVGQVEGDEWDHESTGNYSVAMGHNPLASGRASVSLGNRTRSTDDNAVAMGNQTVASGYSSFAMGANARASGPLSLAFGSFAEARGTHAMAFGRASIAQSYGSLVLGRYNIESGSSTQWIPTDPLLVAGNGSEDSGIRSNALTLLKNGDLTLAGTLTESSDIRLKTGVEPMRGVLDGVLRLTPIRYRYRAGTGHPSTPQIGLSAQEVRGVFPELVREDSESYLSVAYTDLAAVLVGAVREQQAELETRTAAHARETAALRAELSLLRAELAELRRVLTQKEGSR